MIEKYACWHEKGNNEIIKQGIRKQQMNVE